MSSESHTVWSGKIKLGFRAEIVITIRARSISAGFGIWDKDPRAGFASRRVSADFVTAEFNRAFVLMQYFGYLRRNPNDAPEPGLNFDGYNFWLNKLNKFEGNFVNAEMVKAFIDSSEYRRRFGP